MGLLESVVSWQDRLGAALPAPVDEARAAWAASHGWQYAARHPALAQRFGGLPRLGSDTDTTAEHVVLGTERGRPFAAFGYAGLDQGASDGVAHRWFVLPVVAVRLPAALPEVLVRDERVVDRLLGAQLTGDVELESEDVNRRFRFTGPDRAGVYAVLTPRVLELLQARLGPGLCLRVAGPDLLVWDPDRSHAALPAPQGQAGWLDLALDLLDLLPAYLLRA